MDYKFDVARSSWCDLTLSFDIAKNMVDLSNVIRKAAEKAIVHEVSRASHTFKHIMGKKLFVKLKNCEVTYFMNDFVLNHIVNNK